MTARDWIALGLVALNAAFCAGGFWFLVRQMRRDLNGLGAKVNRTAADADRSFAVIAILLLVAAGDEEKQRLADRLLEMLAR